MTAARDKVRAELDDMTRRLQFVTTHMTQIVTRLTSAAGGDDGYPSGSTGGTSGGTGESTSVERAAIRRIARRGQPDPATADLRHLEHRLERASLEVWRLEQAVRRYTAVPPEPERRCTTCARLVLGPTRRGLCGACYKAWERAGKPGQVSA
jgi:hypothetical protein